MIQKLNYINTCQKLKLKCFKLLTQSTPVPTPCSQLHKAKALPMYTSS